MLLADHLERLNLHCTVVWVPRSRNCWADELSKGELSRFDPAKRSEVPLTWFADVQATVDAFNGQGDLLEALGALNSLFD